MTTISRRRPANIPTWHRTHHNVSGPVNGRGTHQISCPRDGSTPPSIPGRAVRGTGVRESRGTAPAGLWQRAALAGSATGCPGRAVLKPREGQPCWPPRRSSSRAMCDPADRPGGEVAAETGSPPTVRRRPQPAGDPAGARARAGFGGKRWPGVLGTCGWHHRGGHLAAQSSAGLQPNDLPYRRTTGPRNINPDDPRPPTHVDERSTSRDCSPRPITAQPGRLPRGKRAQSSAPGFILHACAPGPSRCVRWCVSGRDIPRSTGSA